MTHPHNRPSWFCIKGHNTNEILKSQTQSTISNPNQCREIKISADMDRFRQKGRIKVRIDFRHLGHHKKLFI